MYQNNFELDLYQDKFKIFFTVNRSIHAIALLLYLILTILIVTNNQTSLEFDNEIELTIWQYNGNQTIMDIQRHTLSKFSLKSRILSVCIFGIVTEFLKLLFEGLEGSYQKLIRNNYTLWKWIDVFLLDGLVFIIILQLNGEVNFHIQILCITLMFNITMNAFTNEHLKLVKDNSLLYNWNYFLLYILSLLVLLSIIIIQYNSSNQETYLVSPQGAPNEMLTIVVTFIVGSVITVILSFMQKINIFSKNEDDNGEFSDTIHTFINTVIRSVILFTIFDFFVNNETLVIV
jgi:hypothetical protein